MESLPKKHKVDDSEQKQFNGPTWTIHKGGHREDHHTHHGHDQGGGHGHTHEPMENAGHYEPVALAAGRDLTQRAFTVGLGGPVGSGKTALMLSLCKVLRDRLNIAAVTNDIFTREDGEFLIRNKALSEDRIVAVETGGCPHAAIREDITANLEACERLTVLHAPLDLLLLESGGDNLAAAFSPELADYSIYVIDVAGGDKVPRKGGPGVTQSSLLVINKTDLAQAVGADLKIMEGDAHRMRSTGGCAGPVVMAQAKNMVNVDKIVGFILESYEAAKKTQSTRKKLEEAT